MTKVKELELLSTKIYPIAEKLWKVALFGPDNYKSAVICHYVYSKSKRLKKDAIQFAKELMDGYLDEELTNVVTEQALQYLIQYNDDIPFPKPAFPKFKFIDLFAGIGGFRLAMQNLGGECVFSSEWDKEAQKTYYANFGEIPFGDITKEETKKWIPKNFDVLCAGFPCQAFSIAGKRGGFNDTRGTLFYDVAEIIRRHQPKAIFLENVKGLFNHNGGKTLDTILNTLREDLGYFVPDPEIKNAKYYSVPQNRERVFIVGFHPGLKVSGFEYPQSQEITVALKQILEKKVVNAKYYMSTQYWNTLVKHKERHASKGNGFGFEILNSNGVANAIVVGGMGRERNLIIDKRLKDYTPTTKIKGEINREGIRRLTPREWARLQGFPDHYIIDKVADASAYKQFGNSVAVPAIQATAEKIVEKIQKHLK